MMGLAAFCLLSVQFPLNQQYLDLQSTLRAWAHMLEAKT